MNRNKCKHLKAHSWNKIYFKFMKLKKKKKINLWNKVEKKRAKNRMKTSNTNTTRIKNERER